ncbi:hypothetical protein HGRIS_012441 [Hohenbuehelia grisea]|uniref:Uncharacterized protein n=1 Tax=Hohenbuehelia grisea TaxID=104357 RepID=A0ABR3ISE1_9AGAR
MAAFALIKVAILLALSLPIVSGLTIYVLESHPGTTEQEACSAADIKKIEEMVDSALKMADETVKALANPDVAKSSAFLSLFGSKAKPADIAAQHYTPILRVLKKPSPIRDLKSIGEHDLVFTCPVEKYEKKAAKVGGVYASTRNWDVAAKKLNLIRIMPLALEADSTIDAVAKEFQAKKTFKEPVPLPFTLIHEAQHSTPIVGVHRVGDQEVGGKKMYGLNQIRNILPEDLKVKNAQNFAWFAMLAVSHSDLLTDDCKGSPAAISRDLSSQEGRLLKFKKRYAAVCKQWPSDDLAAKFKDEVE